MCDIAKEQIREIFHDIKYLWETEFTDEANDKLAKGARLLCVNKNPLESEKAFSYVLGWPENAGEFRGHNT
jgi:hypothetical protein